MCLLAVRMAALSVVIRFVFVAHGMMIGSLTMVMCGGVVMARSLVMSSGTGLATLAPNLLVKRPIVGFCGGVATRLASRLWHSFPLLFELVVTQMYPEKGPKTRTVPSTFGLAIKRAKTKVANGCFPAKEVLYRDKARQKSNRRIGQFGDQGM